MGGGGWTTQILVTAAPLLVVGIAIWKGGEQRRAGVAVGLAWVVSWLVTPLNLPGPSYWLFCIDVMLALWLVLMSKWTPAPWIVLTASCSCLLVVNHIAFATAPVVHDWAFFTVSYVWSLGVLIGLLWGVGSRRTG